MTKKRFGQIVFPALLIGAHATRAAQPPSVLVQPAQPVAIMDVTIIDGSGRPPMAQMAVAVDGGRITYVGPSLARPKRSGERVIDGRGKFLPGLIDTHAHVTYIEWPADATDSIGRVNDEVRR